MAGVPILITDKLTKHFGGLRAVSDVDLAVTVNSIHSIIGPNGAGKTTLFNLITQNQQATSGSVLFRGERLDGYTPDRVAAAGISRTYQNIRLFRNITAIENLLVGMHLHLRSTWWGAAFNTRATREDEARAHEEASRLLAVRRFARAWRHAGAQPRVWRATPAGDRPCAGHQAEPADAG